MRNEIWQPNWSEAVSALSAARKLEGEEAASLKQAYLFLRHCESVLRRYENTSVSTLPSDAKELLLVARRMRATTTETFRQQYEDARSTIHKTFLRHMSGKSSGQMEKSKEFAEKKKTDHDSGTDDQG
jgi:glutamine synthetase adenylyltransferase